MKELLIKKIFKKRGIEIYSVKRINIGFTNKIYFIDDKFVLKICSKKINERNFEKEIFLYFLFKNKIHVPEIIFYDTSKEIANKYFMVYKKIDGNSLSSEWNSSNWQERKNIIKELCEIIRKINHLPYKNFMTKFGGERDWHKEMSSNIKCHINKISRRKILSEEMLFQIKKFTKKNLYLLMKEKPALVYWDIHFDNILLKNKKIAGLLDFEGVDIMSIDYVLSHVRRLQNYPEIYVSEDFEKKIKKEDYSHLLKWFKEFYPELFRFKNLNRRLDLYDLEYDLKLLLDYPNSKKVKERLNRLIVNAFG